MIPHPHPHPIPSHPTPYMMMLLPEGLLLLPPFVYRPSKSGPQRRGQSSRRDNNLAIEKGGGAREEERSSNVPNTHPYVLAEAKTAPVTMRPRVFALTQHNNDPLPVPLPLTCHVITPSPKGPAPGPPWPAPPRLTHTTPHLDSFALCTYVPAVPASRETSNSVRSASITSKVCVSSTILPHKQRTLAQLLEFAAVDVCVSLSLSLSLLGLLFIFLCLSIQGKGHGSTPVNVIPPRPPSLPPRLSSSPSAPPSDL